MDTTNHTVTVPIADYNEMLEAQQKLDNIAANVSAHANLLVESTKNGRIFFDTSLDLNRTPRSCKIQAGLYGGPMDAVKIIFEYE